MAEFVRTEKWRRWSGSIADLIRVCSAADAELQKRISDAPTCGIEVVTPQLITRLTGFDELNTIASHDLPSISAIRIRFAREGASSPRIAIDVDANPPAMSLEIQANDKVWVDGVTQALSRLLNLGKRWPGFYDRRANLLPFLLAAVPTFAVILLVTRQRPVVNGIAQLERSDGVIILVAVVLLFVAGVFMLWLTPDLELLAPSGQTRIRRLRGRSLALGVAILAGYIAAGLYAVLHL